MPALEAMVLYLRTGRWKLCLLVSLRGAEVMAGLLKWGGFVVDRNTDDRKEVARRREYLQRNVGQAVMERPAKLKLYDVRLGSEASHDLSL